MKKFAYFISTLSIAAAPILVSLSASAQAPDMPKGDAAAGKQKAIAVCSGCHGAPGTKTAYPEVYYVPKIGNQQAGYLYSALKSYKNGDRYNQTMKALASSLTDKEMADIAAYYGQSAAQLAAK